MTPDPFKVQVTHTFDARRVADLLCCAFEGGSNYWIDRVETLYDYRAAGLYVQDVPLIANETLHVHPTEGEPPPVAMTRAMVEKGLALLFSENYAQHGADFLAENEDADTGDAFLQLCLFQEIIFG